jgi:hypothetical protein
MISPVHVLHMMTCCNRFHMITAACPPACIPVLDTVQHTCLHSLPTSSRPRPYPGSPTCQVLLLRQATQLPPACRSKAAGKKDSSSVQVQLRQCAYTAAVDKNNPMPLIPYKTRHGTQTLGTLCTPLCDVFAKTSPQP